MNLFESIGSFLKPKKIKTENNAPEEQVKLNFDDTYDFVRGLNAFLNDSPNYDYFSQSYGKSKPNIIDMQNLKIDTYRRIANFSDVSNGLDEIINEVVYNNGVDDILKIDIDIDNKDLVKKIEERFDDILGLFNLEDNFYDLVRQTYIDGQINLFLTYSKPLKNQLNEDLEDNIRHIINIKLLEPKNLIFNKEKNIFNYVELADSYSAKKYKETDVFYKPEEIVKLDFGIRTDDIILSYLDKVVRNANILKLLEDLLIPLRFSRSVSRRVFNVDVSKLPSRKATEVLKEYAEKLKYKKTYNSETGEVSNDSHITSLVEDYWFSNRDGQKGVSVETIDETGNLGELGDINYFLRKLYMSMQIPLARLDLENNTSEYSFSNSTDEITREELKFQTFISRIRRVYTNMIKEVLKRELLVSKTLKDYDEWDEIKNNIKIYFNNENAIFEKLKLQNFKDRVSLTNDIDSYVGKYFTRKDVLRRIWKLNDNEINELVKNLKEEKNNKDFQEIFGDNNGY